MEGHRGRGNGERRGLLPREKPELCRPRKMMLAALIASATVLALLYVAFFGVLAKPQWSIYAYVVLWVGFPKAARLYYLTRGAYDLPEGVTLYEVLQIIAIAGILAALFRRRDQVNHEPHHYKPLRAFIGLFLLTIVFSVAVSLGVLSPAMSQEINGLWAYLAQMDWQSRILPFLSMLYSAVFLCGCLAFISQLKQMEILFLMFFLSGIELGLETIVFYYLRLFPDWLESALFAWPTSSMERFKSLIFTNFDMAGSAAIIGLCCGLYFGLSRQMKVTFWLLPLITLPVLTSHERSSLLAVAAGITFIVWMTARMKWKAICLGMGGAALVFSLLIGSTQALIDVVGKKLGGETRPDYFSVESTQGRSGLYWRAIDVVVFLFPFGTGSGMASYAMNYPAPRLMSEYALKTAPFASEIYEEVASGKRTTNVHNRYLEYIVEYGLLGLIGLCWFVFMIVRNFFLWRRRARDGAKNNWKVYVAQACVFGALLGLGIHNVFESTYNPFWIYFLFAYFTFLLLELEIKVMKGSLHPVASTASGFGNGRQEEHIWEIKKSLIMSS